MFYLQSRYKVKKCHATLQYNSEFHYLYGKANDDPRRSDIVCKDWLYEIEEGLTPYDYLGYNTAKKVDVMPKRIIFHKGTWEFYQLIGFDSDLEEYIIRPYKMKRARYQNVTQEELDDDYTNDKNEIMQLMEEREKIISDRLSFAEYIYDKIPERTIWTYYHVVRQLDHIQNMDFYKDEKNKQTLAQVRHPLRKAIRRKQKYMHRFISNEDIERFRNLIIAEEHKNCKDYINYKKSYEYLFYFGFTKIRDKCKDTLKIIARMKKELEEINDLKEDRKGS